MDKKLRAIALALRSLTDLAFAIHIEALIHDRINVPPDHDINPKDHASKCIDKRKTWLSKNIVIDFIGILPIPQVTISIVIFRMKLSAAIGNALLLLQFVARSCQIYHLERQFRIRGKWTTSAFYFFMYIIAGNVLGAFWYILSIERVIVCWHQACRNTTGCVTTTYCRDTSSGSSTNIMLLNELCPINPSNATIYDFGIFLGALQSGNTGLIDFWTKYFYTFWWGIRNLSNFGTGLETSSYPWENFFTLFISLLGLLLFIYLMGNVQTYILWESTRALEDQEKKVNAKYQDLETWLSTNGIPEKTKTEVVKIVKQNRVAEKNYVDGLNAAVDLIFVLNAIKGSDEIKLDIKKHFCQNALNKVAILQHLYNKNDWKQLLDVLDPVSYEKDTCVVQKGKPIDKMLIITEGAITCTDNTRSDAATTSIMPESRFEKGDIYGQELLSMNKDHPTPESTRDVKCETKVEAFTLTADKLKSYMLERAPRVALEYRSHDLKKAIKFVTRAYRWLTTTRSAEKSLMQQTTKMDCKEKDVMGWLSRNHVPDDLQTSVMKHIKANPHVLEKDLDAEVDVKYLFSIGLSWDIECDIKKHLCMNTLHKVHPNLVDEDVLHRICMSLEPVILPKNNHVFNAGDEIDRMLIIVEGEIKLTERTFNRGFGPAPAERPVNVKRIKKGDFFGEQLLISAFPHTSISMSRPAFSNQYVECCTKVEAFVLPKKGVESVVAYYRNGSNEFEQLENGRDGVADTKGASTSTTTIEQRLDQLIQLQTAIRDEMANQGRKLDEMAASLAKVGYPGAPLPPEA
ncbi:hypothetical protein M0R45_016885 [Rubus argutus]|uniref:Cyclic nucleotide-binding domain-containing protein n=1 Tax=Rubus argutus TaxID=59490 RepID=A0AAW1XWE5_RUBAR